MPEQKDISGRKRRFYVRRADDKGPQPEFATELTAFIYALHEANHQLVRNGAADSRQFVCVREAEQSEPGAVHTQHVHADDGTYLGTITAEPAGALLQPEGLSSDAKAYAIMARIIREEFEKLKPLLQEKQAPAPAIVIKGKQTGPDEFPELAGRIGPDEGAMVVDKAEVLRGLAEMKAQQGGQPDSPGYHRTPQAETIMRTRPDTCCQRCVFCVQALAAEYCHNQDIWHAPAMGMECLGFKAKDTAQ